MKLKIEDFWDWAEQHKEYIDWKSFPRHVFLPEPEWLDEQKNSVGRYRKWTEAEDKKLADCISRRYSYSELAKELDRSKGSVRRRIYDLYLPAPRKENQTT